MNKNQYQKRQQFIQVSAVMAGHQDVVKSLPALDGDSQLLADKIKQINQLAQQQLTGSVSATVAKRAARTTMVDGVMDLVARMTSYGDATGDLTLLAEIKTTRSDLQYGRAATALFRARRIVAKARDLQAKLEKDYKLTTAVIDAASAQVEDFGILIEAPGKAIDTRAVTTQTLDEVIAEASRILTRRITGQVFTLREDHPGFVAAFEQASVLEGRRAADPTPQQVDLAAAPLGTAAPASAPALVEAAPAATNGNGRHTTPEPVVIDLAR